MQIIRDRQALHAIPEPGMELPKTAAYIKNWIHLLTGG